jgi:hypothetical protein
MPFTVDEKLKELDREIMQRHRVYKRLVASGKMHRDTASRQIAILSEIAGEYRDKMKEGPLFNQDRGPVLGLGWDR